MKILKRFLVFVLIIICPLMVACSLDPNERDSKYGSVKLRSSNVGNYIQAMSVSTSAVASGVQFNIEVSLIDRITKIEKDLEIVCVVTYHVTFKNLYGSTETKEWKNMELKLNIDEQEPDDADLPIKTTKSLTFVFNEAQEIYSGGIKINYYKSASGKIFMDRPADESGAIV